MVRKLQIALVYLLGHEDHYEDACMHMYLCARGGDNMTMVR